MLRSRFSRCPVILYRSIAVSVMTVNYGYGPSVIKVLTLRMKTLCNKNNKIPTKIISING